MKTVFDISDITSESFVEDNEKFLIRYIWFYEKKGANPLYFEVFEISWTFNVDCDYWSRTTRFVSYNNSQNKLYNLLLKKGKKVFIENLPSSVWEWDKLLYRNIKKLPVLKIKDIEEEKDINEEMNFKY
jgi:hypothetical protein